MGRQDIFLYMDGSSLLDAWSCSRKKKASYFGATTTARCVLLGERRSLLECHINEMLVSWSICAALVANCFVIGATLSFPFDDTCSRGMVSLSWDGWRERK